METQAVFPAKTQAKMLSIEQSLNNLDDVMAEMRFKVQCVDEDIRRIVRNQTNVGKDAATALEEAQTAIAELFTQGPH